MKKWLIVLTVLYCFSLCGCGNKNADGETTDTTDNSLSTEIDETTEFMGTEPTKEIVGDSGNASNKENNTGKQENTKPTEATQADHTHFFSGWKVTQAATCTQGSVETRKCTRCTVVETRTHEPKGHTYAAGSYICSTCHYVDIRTTGSVAELGNLAKYEKGNVANYVWDVYVFNGKVYRGAGDYDKNSGKTDLMAFNIAENCWEINGTADDEAIHRYVEIDGKLYAPGIDSNDGDGQVTGNFYTLENNTFKKVRNVPNGVHCFDMIGFDGKMFIATGTGKTQKVIAMSTDNGKSWNYLPIYKDGNLIDASGHDQSWSRGYEFAEFGGKLYAMVSFKEASGYTQNIFVYDGDKMVYVNTFTFGQSVRNRVNRVYWQGKVEFQNKLYLVTDSLYSISDFSNASTRKVYKLDTGKEMATDVIVHNNTMYVLSYMTNSDGTYKTVIFKSTTGEAGSFTKVASFDYGGIPYSFDFDGTYFYVGIGQASTNSPEKAGMLLRVKP